MKNKTVLSFAAACIVLTVFSVRPVFSDPAADKTALAEAENHLTKKEYSEAETIFDNLVKSADPDIRRQGFYGLGRAYYFQGEFSEAKAQFKAAIAIKQDFDHLKESEQTHTLAGIFVYLSYLSMADGKFDEAIATLKKGVSAGLVVSNAHNFNGSNFYTLIGKNYMGLGDIESAKAYFSESRVLQIQDPAVALLVGQISSIGLGECYRAAGDYTTAVSFFKQAIKDSRVDNERTLDAYIGCSDAYLLNEDFAAASRECAEKLESIPGGVIKIKAWYNLAVIALKNDKPLDAVGYFQKILTAIDGYAPGFRKMHYSFNFDLFAALAHYNLGTQYFVNKEYDQALMEMSKAAGLANSPDQRGLLDKVNARYVVIVAKYGLMKIYEAEGKQDLAAKEAQGLTEFIAGIPAQEQSLIEKKMFNTYIDGKFLKDIRKELSAS